MRDVHADDSQNALSLNFNAPVDPAMFEHLSGDVPDWIQMAYGNLDSGVIRAARPVTFLTRQEQDGFSLRMAARAPAGPPPPPLPTPPPPPMPLRGQVDGPPPPDDASIPPPSFGAARNFYALELAVKRNDPTLTHAYDRASAEADSDIGIGGEYHHYHGGDTVIASNAHERIDVGGGLSLVGSLDDTDVQAKHVQFTNGTVGPRDTNILSGSGGLALEVADGGEVEGRVLAGNGVIGGSLGVFADNGDGFWNAALAYHAPYMETAAAVVDKAERDQVTLGVQYHLGYGVWGGLSGFGQRYGIQGFYNDATTAGWTGDLRWTADFNGWLAGLAYDGKGEYVANRQFFTTGGSTFQPLGIRNMEVHDVTASLSSNIWDNQFWFDLFGGYAIDRYANSGALYGAALRYTPTPGVDLALGVRQSAVSTVEGETGSETSAGLTFTLGFGTPRRSVMDF